MEIIIGSLVWGGLLFVVWRAIARRRRGPEAGAVVAPARPTAAARPPTAPPPAARTPPVRQPVPEESEREAGALVDGLIIGHHLTRTHYEDRLEEQSETIDALRADASDLGVLGGDEDDDEDAYEDDDEHAAGGFGSWDGHTHDELDEYDEPDELDELDDFFDFDDD